VQKKNMDEVVFEKVGDGRAVPLVIWVLAVVDCLVASSEQVTDNVREGHQVMVFVHARKETVKSGMTLHDQMQKEGTADDYDCTANPQWERFHRDIGTSKNKEMKELFMYGIGIHHAGMLRSDRNLMERAFEANCLKVSFPRPSSSQALKSVSRLTEFLSLLGPLLYVDSRVGCQPACPCGRHQGHPSLRLERRQVCRSFDPRRPAGR
jgi:hypothetical protein